MGKPVIGGQLTDDGPDSRTTGDHGSGDPAAGLVLSLGSINADFQVRTARRPELSETLIATDFRRFSGGKAANIAYFARRLGLESRLFGHVGDDDLSAQALSPLRDIGVDLHNVKKVANGTTGVSMIMVPPDGKKGIVLATNANDAWSEADAEAVAASIAESTLQSVLVVDCEVPVFVLEKAVKAASRRGYRILLDPSPADRVTDTLIASAEIVVPNPSEAEHLTGFRCDQIAPAVRAGRALMQRGATAACVKLSDGGCVYLNNVQNDGEEQSYTHFGAVPVEVTDTTGAGDAFAGALAVAMVEQRPAVEAIRFAVAASHLAVTGYGSQSILPQRHQIEHMASRIPVNSDVIPSH